MVFYDLASSNFIEKKYTRGSKQRTCERIAVRDIGVRASGMKRKEKFLDSHF